MMVQLSCLKFSSTNTNQENFNLFGYANNVGVVSLANR